MQHSVSDVLSLVMKLNEQSSLKISADKDNRLLLFNECIKKIREIADFFFNLLTYV